VADKISKCEPWYLPGVREAVETYYKDAIAAAWAELQKPDKPFAICTISRSFLADKFENDKVLDLTDEQMEEIADGCWNELMAETLDVALEFTLEHLGIDLKEANE
jgi:hypothetical protein